MTREAALRCQRVPCTVYNNREIGSWGGQTPRTQTDKTLNYYLGTRNTVTSTRDVVPDAG